MSSDLPQLVKEAMARTGYNRSLGWLAYDAFRAHLLACQDYVEQNTPRTGVLLPDFMALAPDVKAAWEHSAKTVTSDLQRQLVQCREAFNKAYAELHELQQKHKDDELD